MSKCGGPAFPVIHKQVSQSVSFAQGMSLRDWFATFAPDPDESDYHRELQKDNLKAKENDMFIRRSLVEIKCELSYQYADAMLKAR